MKDKKITLREYRGRSNARLLNFIFELLGDENYRTQVIGIIKNYEYLERRQTDSEPHPRSKDRYLSEIPDPTTSVGLARIILESMGVHYNSKTASKIKEYLLKNLENGPRGI